MNPQDTLATFAQVAVAFAGFAGLAGVLSSGFRGEAADVAALRLRGTVELALITVAFSVLPLTVLNLAADEVLAWRMLSLALAVATTAYIARITRTVVRLPVGGRLWRLFSLLWFVAGVGILALNACGVFETPAWYYILGLLFDLLWALILFARLFRMLVHREGS